MILRLVLISVVLLPYLFLLNSTNQNKFAMYFLDVGQGDATLIQTSKQNYCLIDTGKHKNIVEPLSQKAPFLKELDCLILTHADSDHIEATLAILKRYKIKKLFVNYTTKANGLISEIQLELSKHNVDVYALTQDTDFYLDDVYFDVLWPLSPFSELEQNLDSNDASIALKISYKEFKFFTAGDLSLEYEEKLDLSDVSASKASHHGSKTSTSSKLLEMTLPEFIIISAGKNNSYGHPSEQVLETIRSAGKIDIYRTDTMGTITLEYTGSKIEVSCDHCIPKIYSFFSIAKMK